MIKGVRLGGMNAALSYPDTLEVPIIDNTPHERDLKDSMAEAMKKHPNAAGVLVRQRVEPWNQTSLLVAAIVDILMAVVLAYLVSVSSRPLRRRILSHPQPRGLFLCCF